MRRNSHTNSKMTFSQHLRAARRDRVDGRMVNASEGFFIYEDAVKAFGLPNPPPEVYCRNIRK